MVELPPNSGTARDSNPRISKNSEGCACGSPCAGDPPIASHVETRALASETADTEYRGSCRCNHDHSHARSRNHDETQHEHHHDANGACGHDVAERGCGCHHEARHEHPEDETQQ